MTDLTMLAFWAGLLAAFAYLPLSAQQPGLLRSASKTVPLLCFASSAYLAGAHPFLTAALLLSAVGDLALSRPSQRAFNYGLAAFSLTHVLYTLLFTAISGAPLWAAFAEAPLFAVPLVGLAISAEIWLLPHTGTPRWPVRVYVALITAMMLSALTLPAIFVVATLGAAAFVGSDFHPFAADVPNERNRQLAGGNRLVGLGSLYRWPVNDPVGRGTNLKPFQWPPRAIK